MAQKILVTGGTGYIGSHTVVELQQSGYDIVIVDNLSNSNIDVLKGIAQITGITPSFYHIDCMDFEKLKTVFVENQDIVGVIHFAASKAVGESMEKPLLYYKNNLISLMNILELMPLFDVQHLVFSSSCTVYGQPDELPVKETSPIKKALSPYGNTKQICEEIIQDTTVSSEKIQSIILRYFNPIGAHSSSLIGELPNGVPQNLVPFITQTARGIRSELSVFGNDYNTPDGSCLRDYINVVDLAKAHVVSVKRLLNKKNKSNCEIFNIGTGNALSVLELIEVFQQSTQVKVPYKIVDRRAGDIEKVWADATLANKELGWTATESIQETLKSAWNWELRLKQK